MSYLEELRAKLGYFNRPPAVGDLYKQPSGEVYILAAVATRNFALINIKNGNRFVEPQEDKSKVFGDCKVFEKISGELEVGKEETQEEVEKQLRAHKPKIGDLCTMLNGSTSKYLVINVQDNCVQVMHLGTRVIYPYTEFFSYFRVIEGKINVSTK